MRSARGWYIAVRIGGHGPPGSDNIANGVTIDLGLMNGSKNIPDRGFASVEPGEKRKDVYYNLLPHGNVTVTGGRNGGVGLGGFLLCGGNSYYNGRNGCGCDEVVGYHVVLANVTIAEVNAKENPDLWKALKGGGFNFGIVKRFNLQLTTKLRQMTIGIGTDVDLVYLNYADFNQNPLGSYGADNVAFIGKVVGIVAL